MTLTADALFDTIKYAIILFVVAYNLIVSTFLLTTGKKNVEGSESSSTTKTSKILQIATKNNTLLTGLYISYFLAILVQLLSLVMLVTQTDLFTTLFAGSIYTLCRYCIWKVMNITALGFMIYSTSNYVERIAAMTVPPVIYTNYIIFAVFLSIEFLLMTFNLFAVPISLPLANAIGSFVAVCLLSSSIFHYVTLKKKLTDGFQTLQI